MGTFARYTKPTYPEFTSESLQDKILLPAVKQARHDQLKKEADAMRFKLNSIYQDRPRANEKMKEYEERQDAIIKNLMSYGVDGTATDDFYALKKDYNRDMETGEGKAMQSRVDAREEWLKAMEKLDLDPDVKSRFQEWVDASQVPLEYDAETGKYKQFSSMLAPESVDVQKWLEGALGTIKSDKVTGVPSNIKDKIAGGIPAFYEVLYSKDVEYATKEKIVGALQNMAAGNPKLLAYLDFLGQAGNNFKDTKLGQQFGNPGNLFAVKDVTDDKGNPKKDKNGNPVKEFYVTNPYLANLIEGGAQAGQFFKESSKFSTVYDQFGAAQAKMQEFYDAATFNGRSIDLKRSSLEDTYSAITDGKRALNDLMNNPAFSQLLSDINSKNLKYENLTPEQKQQYDSYLDMKGKLANLEIKARDAARAVEEYIPDDIFSKYGRNINKAVIEDAWNRYIKDLPGISPEDRELFMGLNTTEGWKKAFNSGKLYQVQKAFEEDPTLGGATSADPQMSAAQKQFRSSVLDFYDDYNKIYEDNFDAISEKLTTTITPQGITSLDDKGKIKEVNDRLTDDAALNPSNFIVDGGISGGDMALGDFMKKTFGDNSNKYEARITLTESSDINKMPYVVISIDKKAANGENARTNVLTLTGKYQGLIENIDEVANDYIQFGKDGNDKMLGARLAGNYRFPELAPGTFKEYALGSPISGPVVYYESPKDADKTQFERKGVATYIVPEENEFGVITYAPYATDPTEDLQESPENREPLSFSLNGETYVFKNFTNEVDAKTAINLFEDALGILRDPNLANDDLYKEKIKLLKPYLKKL